MDFFKAQLSLPEFDGDYEKVNYLDQESTLEGGIGIFLSFWQQNVLQLSNY